MIILRPSRVFISLMPGSAAAQRAQPLQPEVGQVGDQLEVVRCQAAHDMVGFGLLVYGQHLLFQQLLEDFELLDLYGPLEMFGFTAGPERSRSPRSRSTPGSPTPPGMTGIPRFCACDPFATGWLVPAAHRHPLHPVGSRCRGRFELEDRPARNSSGSLLLFTR
jgi:hypothetical protein